MCTPKLSHLVMLTAPVCITKWLRLKALLPLLRFQSLWLSGAGGSVAQYHVDNDSNVGYRYLSVTIGISVIGGDIRVWQLQDFVYHYRNVGHSDLSVIVGIARQGEYGLKRRCREGR